VRLRFRICHLLSILRIHNPDCEHCNARATCGEEMRERLEELNCRTQPRSLKNGGSGAPVEASDSKPPKV
jgi:tRNA(Ile2) C34 agmatinyltransferase TiaS